MIKKVQDFGDKILESVPWINRMLLFKNKRIAVIVEGEELQASNKFRATVNVRFFRAVEEVGKEFMNGGFVLKKTNAESNSMNPGLDGHLICVVPLGMKKPFRFQDLKVGDVIWFHRELDGTPDVLHRIIRKERDYVVCRGDNTVIIDGKIYKKYVKGVHVATLY